MITSIRHSLLLIAVGFVAACATDRTIGTSPDVEATTLEDLPAPRGDYIYNIGPQETLEIDVLGAEPLSGTFLTNENGHVFYPFLGELDFNGKTPNAASQIIADGLREKYLVDPQVRVMPTEFPAPSVSIGGQVSKPGEYPAKGKQTLLRMVNQAGGLTKYAQLDDVLIMRTVEGRNYIGVYNIGAIQRGNYADPVVYPNDIVMVGDSPARRRLENILQFVPLFTSSVILFDRLNSN